MGLQLDAAREKELRELTDTPDEFLKELLEAVQKTLVDGVAGCKAALEAGDSKAIKLGLHTMKGAVLNIGLEPLSGTLTAADAEAGQQNLENTQAALEVIESHLPALGEMISQYR